MTSAGDVLVSDTFDRMYWSPTYSDQWHSFGRDLVDLIVEWEVRARASAKEEFAVWDILGMK